MNLVQIGISHKTAPIEVREKLSITKEHLPTALAELIEDPLIRECVLLSTCNRTEIYLCSATSNVDRLLPDRLGQVCGIDSLEFVDYLLINHQEDAARHLFRVSSGIESMAVGETQVQGQVKEAYAVAVEARTTGPVLNALFQQAASVGKRIVSETGISRGAFSVGSAAARLAESVLGEADRGTLLLIGAGQTADLTLKHIASGGFKELLVTNRTMSKAVELAAKFGGRAVPFEQLPAALSQADIIISSTGSGEILLSYDSVLAAAESRDYRPLFIIDLAVPRDVDQTVSRIDNVLLYNLDDLREIVKTNEHMRLARIHSAEKLIEEEVEAFQSWFVTLDAVPVIVALREKFEHLRELEMEKLVRKLKHLSAQDIQVIGAAMGSVVNKICHEPIAQIKNCATGPNAATKLEELCEVFGICPVDRESGSME